MSNTSPHVVSMVYNRVAGDSRVIKTAQAALNAGYSATIVGVTSATSVERAEIEGVPVVLVPNPSGSLGKLGLWGHEQHDDLRLLMGFYVRRAIPEILDLNPDIIHSHDMIGLKIGAAAKHALLASGHDIPWVHDLHEFVAGLEGNARSVTYKPICLGWEREYLILPDKLTTVSDLLASKLVRRYCLKEAPQVTYNVPVAGAFSSTGRDVRSALDLPSGTPLAVFVGGATPLRGCDTIVDACAQVEGLHLVFVSQGKYVEEMKSRAQRMGMSGRFHTHPYVPSDQVSSFIRSADLGIHGLVHYGNAQVALPNKMFEYLHADLPMVLSDVESMKAFIDEYGVGATFEAGNVTSCADAIRTVLSKRESFRSRIDAGLKLRYCWERQEEKIQEIYDHLLKERRDEVAVERRKAAAQWEVNESASLDSAFSCRLAEVMRRAQIQQEKAAKIARPLQALNNAAPMSKTQTKSSVGTFMNIAKNEGLLHAFRRGITRVFG
ncbi:glycosyltransferase [Nitratireductor sp. L1-7-SE]|uniref:Glycosyltransferase n=2 Tax=Nitratireductor rhodophyticola TaxID=2854036 RepID=A0ABS7RDW3_9HYPH|nr:glycosyltransferase [Nitratireductor rhodophyticola]MBY8918834.1 glycosyltransferase [Nitratireductor rhodophyticola]MBY8919983.1 glycosyltransferase [Nitratireductor rhodophyticola]